ncbi:MULTISPECIES: CoA pyrophosphatase [unclassified Marinobacter]|uniref:NUDIX hydrolase n=1 Tax=unclassified Marinobacter TaxID=83889 RepID=UPI0026E194BB|nr:MULTISPECIES: CoA pyrophosphatase [unclassified Marinobacter]MDO6442846.1 CoA pyrophosphatase [Marinobacter sp. 2_MG-2023]MDO6822938.1 CoA pyrophosphatase [Marinobacter sp. 1_MG-2023]
MTPKRWKLNIRPRELPFRRHLARASVALIYRQSEDAGVELLFIQRARKEGDPWSGHMAFPGGRMQPEDANPRATAERETLEETGVDLARNGYFQARLSDLLTRQHSRWRPMVVTPYVYEWRGPQTVSPNHEVEKLLWISLDYLAAKENQGKILWRTRLGTLKLPCCRYQDHCIWGLSYSMLQDLLAQIFSDKVQS